MTGVYSRKQGTEPINSFGLPPYSVEYSEVKLVDMPAIPL